MARDTCRMPSCDREPGAEDSDTKYRERTFCSPLHELKYEHIKDDARDAMMEDRRAAAENSDLPEYSGPPY